MVYLEVIATKARVEDERGERINQLVAWGPQKLLETDGSVSLEP